MSVTVKWLPEWAVHIPENMTDGNETEQTVWMIPAVFCDTRYVDDARYPVAERTIVEERKLRPSQNKLFLNKTVYHNRSLEYVDHDIKNSKALRNICIGEELYADYEERHSFPVDQILKSSSL